MAITTIRDLAFKISMNVQIENLKKADKMVDDFKSKVTSMQRSVSKDIGIMNRNFDNIKTFKAVKRINDITDATKKLKTVTDDVAGKTVDGIVGENSNNKRQPKKIGLFDTWNLNVGVGMLARAFALTTLISKGIQIIKQTFSKSLEVYRDQMDGIIRQEAFFANALKYRERVLGETLNTGARSFEEYREASRKSLEETRKNIALVSQQGVTSQKELMVMTGQLASYQINTDEWFGGKNGLRNLELMSDLMTSVQQKTGSRTEAKNVANMLGKAFAIGHVGRLQVAAGVVFTPLQKELIKTGTRTQKLNALMEALEENVGNLNKVMVTTPYGRMIQQQNKITDQYFKLGENMIFVKIEMLKLFNAIFPVLDFIMKIGGAVIGVLSKVITSIIDAISWVTTFSENNADGFNDMRKALLVLAPLILATFAPALAIFLLIALAIEDIWIYMNDGESVIGDVINWFKNIPKEIGKSIKEINDDIGDFIDDIADNTILRFHDTLKSINDFFSDIINMITEKYDKFINKLVLLKNKIPFIGDSNVNINNTPTIDPVLPTADLSNGNNTPSSILNNNGKNIKLELKIESGAIQQNFDGNTIPTLEDIMWGVEQKMEDLQKTGWLTMMTEWGVLQ